MNILLVGLGSIAIKHVNVLLELFPNFMIYALRSSENSNEVNGVINIYSISNISFDFIIITNPTNLHASTIKRVLHLNKPIFIEKPLFDKIEFKENILNIINSRNIKTYIACNLRFHPALIYLKKYIYSSKYKINEVNIYCGSYLPSWRPNQSYTKSYSANKKLGGGVHLDLIHELDYCIWIFGVPEKSTSCKRKVSNLEINSFDYCNYNLYYKDFNATITLNYYREIPKRIIEVVFENEVISCDLLNSKIYKNEKELIFNNENYNILETYQAQMKYFISNLNSSSNYMNDINESYQILKIALND